MSRPPAKKILLRAPLTSDHVRFVEEYVLDLNAEDAARRAGLDPSIAVALLSRKHVQAAIQTLTLNRSRRTEIYADEVLRRWFMLATVDAREFTQVRRVNCRRCWGRNHQYQFRDPELIEMEMRHEAEQETLSLDRRKEFNDLGGGGYDGWRDPCRGPNAVRRLAMMGVAEEPTSDHDCPSCDGMGEVTIWVNDARNYSPSAVYAYEGVKVSKDGSVEVKTKDAQAALKMVAEHLGMFVTRNVNLDIDPTKLSDDQLDNVLRQFGHLAAATGEDGPLIEHASGGEAEEERGALAAE